MPYLGVDLGGTNIAAGIVDEHGQISARRSVPTRAGRPAREICADMGRLCLDVLAGAGLTRADVPAIGVGLPGVGDSQRGMVYRCPNLGWENVPMSEYVSEAAGLPVVFENDANVAALAESVAGVSRGCENSVFITLGTGVGGGVIIGGRIYSGTRHVGAELGHMLLRAGGELCGCGARGCWEAYASATALIREGRRAAAKHPESALAGVADMSARAVVDAARAGDAAALAVFDAYCLDVALGLASLMNIFDPEVIALGGGVAGAGDFLLERVRAYVEPNVFCRAVPHARVELARLGNDAGIVGAAMLCAGR